MGKQVEAYLGQQSKPSPISKGEVIVELTRCLALVRPVSMTDALASEWLTEAASQVMGYAEQRTASFLSACDRARRTCTHHGQIVPEILSKARYAWEPQGKPFKSAAQIAMEAQRKPTAIERAEVAGLIEGAAKGCKP